MTASELFARVADAAGRRAGRPLTFVICLAVVLAWAISGPLFGFSDTWQLVINTGTTIVTFLMVFLIQNTQNRETSAMQAKLDELIISLEGADNHFIGIEHLTDKQLEIIVAECERRAAKTLRRRSASADAARELHALVEANGGAPSRRRRKPPAGSKKTGRARA